jgi:hypothetical protein
MATAGEIVMAGVVPAIHVLLASLLSNLSMNRDASAAAVLRIARRTARVAPMPELLHVAFAVAVAFLLAGLVKGVIGVGMPTVAMGLMSLVFSPAQAAAILVIPSLVTNVWQAASGPHLRLLARRMATMLVGICAGALAGAVLFGRPDAWATTALGIALAVEPAAVLGTASRRVVG